jgi:hypothetical protein
MRRTPADNGWPSTSVTSGTPDRFSSARQQEIRIKRIRQDPNRRVIIDWYIALPEMWVFVEPIGAGWLYRLFMRREM